MPMPSASAYFCESVEVVVPPEGPFASVCRNFEGVIVNCHVHV